MLTIFARLWAVAHLENLVNLMERDGPDAKANGMEKTAEQAGLQQARAGEIFSQLRQSQAEVRKLKEILHGVQKLIAGVCDTAMDSDSQPRQVVPSGESNAVVPSSGESEKLQASSSQQVISNYPQTLASAASFPKPVNHTNSETSTSPEMAQGNLSHVDSTQFYMPYRIDHAHDGMFLAERWLEPVTSGLSGAVSESHDQELYQFSEREVMKVLTNSGRTLANQPFDEDIVIRSVLHGWPDVEDHYTLDAGWRALKNIDQNVFNRSGLVERMAILRMMRQKMLHQVHCNSSDLPALPEFYGRTSMEDLQQLKITPIIEYYVWPGLRASTLNSPRKYQNNKFSEMFRQNFKFIWPYDVADAYVKDPISHLYSTAAEFARRQRSLHSWAMRKEFFEEFEELSSAIPVFNPPVRKALIPASTGLASTRIDSQHQDQSLHQRASGGGLKKQTQEDASVETITQRRASPLIQAALLMAVDRTATAVPGPDGAEIEAWLGDPDMVPQHWDTQQQVNSALDTLYESQWPSTSGGFCR